MKREYFLSGSRVLWSVAFAVVSVLVFLTISSAGNNYMGGRGDLVDDPPPEDDAALDDNMSIQGTLFGDLYRILRYQGSETFKLVPEVDPNGEPVIDPATGQQSLVQGPMPIGGEPVLSTGYGYYAREVIVGGDVAYELAQAPYPSQCVQPVADYSRWGDIWSDPSRQNVLPLIITYDPTWQRSECEVGQLTSEPTVNSDGTLSYSTNPYFIEPGGSWKGKVYCDGVLWTDLIDEVDFGRISLSRSPEAVLQAALDEAVNAINQARKIEIDAAGRFLLTTDIYEDFATEDGSECEAALIKTVTKAIDSPLENLALYVKLMQDGHLVTPGDEREPIDRSGEDDGIPLWKMLVLEDGPSAALRPTIDIAKMREFGLGNLVDVNEVAYYTYYQCYTADGAPVECICLNEDGEPETCEDVDGHELITVVGGCPEGKECAGPFTGITTDDGTPPTGQDFDFAASFLAAAADKTGELSMDMVVYLNSILNINKVIGYSEYDAEGNPVDGAINYADNPIYFNFADISGYSRESVFSDRGQVVAPPGGGMPADYSGDITVLQSTGGGVWAETVMPIITSAAFENIGLGSDGFADGTTAAADNILGFTQMADDDLNVIEFIHTYQIPGLR